MVFQEGLCSMELYESATEQRNYHYITLFDLCNEEGFCSL